MEKPSRRAGLYWHRCGQWYVTFAGPEQKMGDCRRHYLHYGWE